METIKLDLIPGKKMPSLHASQYDDGRDYHIDLTENRVPYTLDGTETISLTVRKCDNTLVTMDIANTFANKSYIEFRTTEQMNACAGFNYGEITIEKNGTQISSLNFYLQVEGAPDEGGITSQSEINNLARQVHDIVVEELADNGAEQTGYDNTESGLEATNVQDAIDEVNEKVNEKADASSLAEVATSGSYNDLLNKPSIPAPQVNSDWNANSGVSQILNKPTIPTVNYDSEPTAGHGTGYTVTSAGIKQAIDSAGGNVIDDTEPKSNKTFSSNKISDLLNGKANSNEVANLNNGYNWTNPTTTLTTGFINNVGDIRTTIDTNKVTGAILLGNTRKVAVNFSRSNASITTIGFYSKDTLNKDNLVSRIYNVTANTLYDVPDGARYVAFTLPNDVAYTSNLFLFTEALEIVENDISNLKSGFYIESINPTMTNGYVNNIGEIRTGSTYLVSEEVSVAGIEAFALNFTLSNINYMYIAFYGETPNGPSCLIQGYSSVTSGVFIQVPSNAKYARFTIPTVYTSDYIITKKVSNDYNIKTALDRRTNNEETGVIFGDSIIYGLGVIPQGGQVPYNNAVAEVNRILGGTIYNAGLGGSTMCRPNSPNGNNFCELIDALCGLTTWDTIDARVEDSIEHDSRTKGYRTTIGALKTLDFTTVDFVVIAYGTNDWTSDYEVGDDTSTSDKTIAGALKYCLEKLFTLNPNLKIYVVAPAYRYNQSTLVDSNTETHNGKNLREYAQGIEDFVKLYSLPCLNLYTNGNVNIYNRSQFLTDGVHRTLSGYKMLGQQIAKLVMSK